MAEDTFYTDETERLKSTLEAKAVHLLSVREHGGKELAYKLQQKFPEAEKVPSLINEVLSHCQHQGWLSDERFIEAYVRQALDKGQGPLKIQQSLQLRTDREDLVQAALCFDDAEWAEIARSVLEKKYGDALRPKARNEQAKRMRFLQSRGFSASQIWKAFGAAE